MTEELKVKVDSAFANNFIHTQHAYIDICEDLVAGILLAQIIFWFMPDKQGRKKVRVIKDGKYWLAKSRNDWYEEIRITPKQFDRASKILAKKQFIEKKIYKFNADNTVHVRPIYENIQAEIEKWKEKVAAKLVKSSDFPKGEFKDSLKGDSEIDERDNSLTENTTLPTSEETNVSYLGDFSQKNRNDIEESYNDWKDVANKTIKKGRWQWQSLKQYRDYLDVILPRYLNDILKKKHREEQLDSYIRMFRYFFESYREKFGKLHPWYKTNVLGSVIDDLDYYFDGDSYVMDGMEEYIDEFFSKGSLDGYEMKVFSNPNMLKYVRAVVDNDYSEINPFFN